MTVADLRADLKAAIAERDAAWKAAEAAARKLDRMREVLKEGYALPYVEHEVNCSWTSKQSCECGRTEAAWYTHFMRTLDKTLKKGA